MATEELVCSAVRGEDERTVLLVSPVLAVLLSVTDEPPVDTDPSVAALDLPVSTGIVPALLLVPAVTAVLPAVTPPPAVHTGPVSAGDVVGRAGYGLPTPQLVTPVTAVRPPVTHLAAQHAPPLVNTLELTGRTGEVVGPVAWLDGVHTADLVRLVLTVGHPVAPQTEADAGSVVTAELVPAAAQRTVQLVILTVTEAVTPLAEGETGAVTAEELSPTAGRLAAGLVRAVPAVLPAVTAGEVGDAGSVLPTPELRPQAGPGSPALSGVEDGDIPPCLTLRHLLQAEVGVAHPVFPAHRAAAQPLTQREGGGRGVTHLYSLVQTFIQSGLAVVRAVVVVGLAVVVVVTIPVTQSTTDSESKLSV